MKLNRKHQYHSIFSHRDQSGQEWLTQMRLVTTFMAILNIHVDMMTCTVSVQSDIMASEDFKMAAMVAIYDMGRHARKPVFGVSDKARLKPLSSATETS